MRKDDSVAQQLQHFKDYLNKKSFGEKEALALLSAITKYFPTLQTTPEARYPTYHFVYAYLHKLLMLKSDKPEFILNTATQLFQLLKEQITRTDEADEPTNILLAACRIKLAKFYMAHANPKLAIHHYQQALVILHRFKEPKNFQDINRYIDICIDQLIILFQTNNDARSELNLLLTEYNLTRSKERKNKILHKLAAHYQCYDKRIEAIQTYTDAINLVKPDCDGDALAKRGLVFWEVGQYTEAYQDWQNANKAELKNSVPFGRLTQLMTYCRIQLGFGKQFNLNNLCQFIVLNPLVARVEFVGNVVDQKALQQLQIHIDTLRKNNGRELATAREKLLALMKTQQVLRLQIQSSKNKQLLQDKAQLLTTELAQLKIRIQQLECLIEIIFSQDRFNPVMSSANEESDTEAAESKKPDAKRQKLASGAASSMPVLEDDIDEFEEDKAKIKDEAKSAEKSHLATAVCVFDQNGGKKGAKRKETASPTKPRLQLVASRGGMK